MAFLVTYDLNSPGQNYNDVLAKIKAHSGWAKLSESSYAITTSKTSSEVFDDIKTVLDDNDNLYVITLKKPWSGQGLQEVNDWLKDHL